MNRITAIMTAFLVLLLLASGFMAADNIRLSGERAAIADELNQQNYDLAILTRKLENQQKALEALTLERDELLLQLQDYQPADPTLAQTIRDNASALADPADEPTATITPAATATPAPTPTASPRPSIAPIPQADAVTEDIFALSTPAPTSAPAFQSASGSLSSTQLSLLVTDVARLRQRVDLLETRLELILSVQGGQAAIPSPAPAAFDPGEILRKIRENLLFFFSEKEK